jgi:DNA-binding FrmR family transcriptional regulator
MKTSHGHLHLTHAEVVRRLKRAEGHLRSIVSMIGEGRDCLELAQQLHAVEKAIANAKRTLIHDHIDNCLERSIGPMTREARGPMNEFKALAKFL